MTYVVEGEEAFAYHNMFYDHTLEEIWIFPYVFKIH
jgi:hypothetical protein